VTVAGQSAGAMSITTLMAMPRARGLFRQAITQSGAAAQTLTADTALRVGSMLAKSLGVTPTREAVSEVPVERLVRAASTILEEVQAAPDPAKWGRLAPGILPFAPVIDGDTLPVHSLDALAGAPPPACASSPGRTGKNSGRFSSRPAPLTRSTNPPWRQQPAPMAHPTGRSSSTGRPDRERAAGTCSPPC
jgi:para-nitrobenzyl esterase